MRSCATVSAWHGSGRRRPAASPLGRLVVEASVVSAPCSRQWVCGHALDDLLPSTQRYRSRRAVDGDLLAAGDALRGVARAHHRRDTVLTGDDRAMGQDAADVGDQSSRLRESGVQAGVVVGQTRIVPGSICAKSAGEWITLAGAVTRPGLTAKPCSVVASARLRRCVSRPERSIGPADRRWEAPPPADGAAAAPHAMRDGPGIAYQIRASLSCRAGGDRHLQLLALQEEDIVRRAERPRFRQSLSQFQKCRSSGQAAPSRRAHPLGTVPSAAPSAPIAGRRNAAAGRTTAPSLPPVYLAPAPSLPAGPARPLLAHARVPSARGAPAVALRPASAPQSRGCRSGDRSGRVVLEIVTKPPPGWRVREHIEQALGRSGKHVLAQLFRLPRAAGDRIQLCLGLQRL